MNPVELAEKFAGTKCPQCMDPDCILYLVTATSLVGSECCKTVDLDTQNPLLRRNGFLFEVHSGTSGPRYFIARKELAPEELMKELLKAAVILEDCSVGWESADAIQAISGLLNGKLSDLGVIEIFSEEVWKSPDTAKVNETEYWMDRSVLGGADD